jgi:hypothetical protein
MTCVTITDESGVATELARLGRSPTPLTELLATDVTATGLSWCWTGPLGQGSKLALRASHRVWRDATGSVGQAEANRVVTALTRIERKRIEPCVIPSAHAAAGSSSA